MKTSNAMNSDGLHFIWVLEKDRSAYLHVYKSLQKATSALNIFSKIKRGAIDPSIGRTGSMGISQIGHGIGNSKMTIDDIASSVEKKYGVEPEVIRHDVASNPVKQTQKGFMSNTAKIKQLTAIPPEDWLDEAERRERAGDKQGAKTARQFARFLMGQKDAFTNPAEREIGSHPAQGKYTSFKKWAAAVKKIGGRLRSESPVPQTVYGPFGFISQWNGRSGKIEEFFDANPAGREIGSLPEQGKYTSFKKWAAAVKKIGGRLRSESPVRQTVYGPFGFISEWNGRSGKIEEFFDANPVHRNNPVRQRIAVSLSRSQVRRNPFNDRNLDA